MGCESDRARARDPSGSRRKWDKSGLGKKSSGCVQRTVESAILDVGAIVTVAVAEPARASARSIRTNAQEEPIGCARCLLLLRRMCSPVVGRGVAVAVVDEQGIVVDAVLQGVAAGGVNIVWQGVTHRARLGPSV